VSRRLLIVGFACVALSLVVPPLGIVGLILGIIAIVRGSVGAGATLVGLGVVLPFAGAVILQTFVVKPYRIPSEAMVPTLQIGDRIVVRRGGGEPRIGDIVVFHPPQGAESAAQCGARRLPTQPCPRPRGGASDVSFVKRVVAGPGDRVALQDGHVVRNGRRTSEPFVKPCGSGADCDLPTAITVPPDHWFMMGDNRGASNDSRYWGPVPTDWIVGRVFARYWPAGRAGGI
jgi:signal peptidase I